MQGGQHSWIIDRRGRRVAAVQVGQVPPASSTSRYSTIGTCAHVAVY